MENGVFEVGDGYEKRRVIGEGFKGKEEVEVLVTVIGCVGEKMEVENGGWILGIVRFGGFFWGRRRIRSISVSFIFRGWILVK